MERSLILRNIINLSISEVISRLLNFISYIYLARVILVEGFGIISFVIAFSSYFLLIVNFSSDIIASREVARLQVNRETLVSQVIATRILLAIASYALLSVLVMLLQTTSTIRIGLLIYGLTFFAQAFNISWYFRGTEKTLPITTAQIFSSLINVALIVTIVSAKTDLVYAISIITTTAFLNSLLLLGFYRREMNKRLIPDIQNGREQKTSLILDAGLVNERKTSLILDAEFGSENKERSILDSGFMRRNLSESFPVAIAGIMISIYYNLDHVMLGYMTNSTELGYYAAAYKIIIIALVPAGIIYQAFLPQFTRSKNDAYHTAGLMELYSNLMLIVGAFFTTIIFLFAKDIIGIAYGAQYSNSILLIQILAFNIFLVYLNMTYGNPLIAWGQQKQFSYPIIVAAMGNLLLNIILIPRYHAAGAAIATISSELIVLAGFIPLHKKLTKTIHIKNICKSIAGFIVPSLALLELENYLTSIMKIVIVVLSYSFLFHNFKLTSFFRMTEMYPKKRIYPVV